MFGPCALQQPLRLPAALPPGMWRHQHNPRCQWQRCPGRGRPQCSRFRQQSWRSGAGGNPGAGIRASAVAGPSRDATCSHTTSSSALRFLDTACACSWARSGVAMAGGRLRGGKAAGCEQRITLRALVCKAAWFHIKLCCKSAEPVLPACSMHRCRCSRRCMFKIVRRADCAGKPARSSIGGSTWRLRLPNCMSCDVQEC